MAAYSSLIFGAALSASFLSMGANGQTRTAGDCVSINKNQAGPIQNYQAGLLSRTGPTQGTIYSKPTVGFSDLDKINVEGLKEEDIPMLTNKAYDTIKVELENDPKKAAIKATEKWKKILA